MISLVEGTRFMEEGNMGIGDIGDSHQRLRLVLMRTVPGTFG